MGDERARACTGPFRMHGMINCKSRELRIQRKVLVERLESDRRDEDQTRSFQLGTFVMFFPFFFFFEAFMSTSCLEHVGTADRRHRHGDGHDPPNKRRDVLVLNSLFRCDFDRFFIPFRSNQRQLGTNEQTRTRTTRSGSTRPTSPTSMHNPSQNFPKCVKSSALGGGNMFSSV